MSNVTVTDLLAIAAGVIGLLLYVTLILVPAWGSYARLWERLAAAALSLYVLGVLVGVGVFGALLAVYFWG
jgi:O-antigen ligase